MPPYKKQVKHAGAFVRKGPASTVPTKRKSDYWKWRKNRAKDYLKWRGKKAVSYVKWKSKQVRSPDFPSGYYADQPKKSAPKKSTPKKTGKTRTQDPNKWLFG